MEIISNMFSPKVISLLFLGIISIGFIPVYGLNDTQDITNEKRSSSKIHPTILQWQSSQNPDEFAKENNLILRDGKIGVYIYLNDSKAISKISDTVNVISSDGKIAVAFVDSENIALLENSQFVTHITPPVLARNPPIPQVEPVENIEISSEDYTLVWILLIIGIGLVVVLYKKFKSKLF